jgi:hypothetical protein
VVQSGPGDGCRVWGVVAFGGCARIGLVVLLLVSSFGSKPVRSQSIADIGHVVLFMQVWRFGLVSALLISARKIGPSIM